MPHPKKDRRENREGVPVERRATGRDRRKSLRILIDLEVDYKCEDTFLFAYITDMSAFGIFIRTNNPEPAGTHLNMRFKLPGEKETLSLEGEVIWINPFRPSTFENNNPGMGVQFVDLSADFKRRLLSLVRKIAYLEGPEENQPQENLPEENQPQENLPEENQPKENLPEENQPKEKLAEENKNKQQN